MFGLLFIALLTACGSPQRQEAAQYQQSPKLEADAFLPGDGARLGLRQWLPQGKPRAVVLALHGFNDYSRGFQRMGEALAAKGFAVIAPDQRGFGRSPGRGIWPGIDNLRADAGRLVVAAKAAYPGAPLVLLGESMGGAVAITSITEGAVKPSDLAGLVLVAPAVWGGDTFNPLYRAPLWLLANLSPDTVLTGRGLKILPSDNFPMLIALSRDPGMLRRPRADAVLNLVRTMDEGQAAGPKLPAGLPVLILYGERDQIVPAKPVTRLVQACQIRIAALCRAQRYKQGFHMLLRDLHGDKPIADLLIWLADPAAPLPNGTPWHPLKEADGASAPALPPIHGVAGPSDPAAAPAAPNAPQ